MTIFWLRRRRESIRASKRARARGINGAEPNNTGGRYTWSFRFPLIDACRLPVGRLRSQSLRSVPPGLDAVNRAGLRRGAPPRRKRSITRPRDHVTVWPLFHAIISLSICPNDARPIRSSSRLSPSHRPLPWRIYVCVTYLHNAPIVFHTRALYTPIMHVDACVFAYLRTHTRIARTHAYAAYLKCALVSRVMKIAEDTEWTLGPSSR